MPAYKHQTHYAAGKLMPGRMGVMRGPGARGWLHKAIRDKAYRKGAYARNRKRMPTSFRDLGGIGNGY